RVRTSEPGLQVDVESRVPEDVRAALAAMGHEINVIEPFSAMVGGGQGIAVDPETGAFMGGADPRRDGYALGY
ncbi:MAG: gamma-glutamyltransferase, partial [Anaerolineales bacterium]|nr:gamma-glutamyltransferase [Anaerolineales bacterium]